MTKFEDYRKEFGNLFDRAGPYDIEIIKRCLGFSSPALGRGKTKAEYTSSALKLMVNVFIREPIEAKMRAGVMPTNQNMTEQAEDINASNPTTNAADNSESETQASQENLQTNKENEDFKVVQNHKICRNYIKNKCKKGPECTFKHPQICDTYSKFGRS